MLFLFNDHVIELAGGASAAAALLPRGKKLKSVTLAEATALAKAAAFERPRFYVEDERLACAIGWLLACHDEVSACLLVPAARARGPRDVACRLAAIPFISLAALMARQRDGRLTAADVNHAVWLKAA